MGRLPAPPQLARNASPLSRVCSHHLITKFPRKRLTTKAFHFGVSVLRPSRKKRTACSYAFSSLSTGGAYCVLCRQRSAILWLPCVGLRSPVLHRARKSWKRPDSPALSGAGMRCESMQPWSSATDSFGGRTRACKVHGSRSAGRMTGRLLWRSPNDAQPDLARVPLCPPRQDPEKIPAASAGSPFIPHRGSGLSDARVGGSPSRRVSAQPGQRCCHAASSTWNSVRLVIKTRGSRFVRGITHAFLALFRHIPPPL